MQFKSIVTYDVTNVSKVAYDFMFGYLKKSFVKVKVNGTDIVYGVDYMVVDSHIELLKTLALDDTIRIYRETPTDRIVEWNNSSILTSTDMTISEIQTLHRLEEIQDGIQIDYLYAVNDIFDAGMRRIINVLDPEEDSDAANKAYVDTIHERLNVVIENAADSFNAVLEQTKDYQEQAEDAVSRVATLSSAVAEIFDSTKTYNPPDIVVLENGVAYRCVGTSTGENPVESSNWTPVSVCTYETFEKDSEGDIMPKAHPQSSTMWTLDDDENIMVMEV